MPLTYAEMSRAQGELEQHDPQTLGLATGSYTKTGPTQTELIDLEQFSRDPGLGCARGVLWAFLFQSIVVVIAIAVYWEFHLSR